MGWQGLNYLLFYFTLHNVMKFFKKQIYCSLFRTGCTSCTVSTSATIAKSVAITHTKDRKPSSVTLPNGDTLTACVAWVSRTPPTLPTYRALKTPFHVIIFSHHFHFMCNLMVNFCFSLDEIEKSEDVGTFCC